MPQHIQLRHREGIATLAFHRPDQLNAMNRRMMDEIIESLEFIHSEPDIRVAILTGNGKAFMAGADIKEYAAQSPSEFESFQSQGRALYSLIEGNAKPIIAAVNGFAFGGGMEIALACDLIFASTSAQFGLPEIKLALIPGGGGTQRLARKTSLNFAKELLLSGRTASPDELRERGLVNRICPDDKLLREAQSFAAGLCKRPPTALRALKQLAELAVPAPPEAALRLEMQWLGELYRSEAGQAKIQQFLQRSLDQAKSK